MNAAPHTVMDNERFGKSRVTSTCLTLKSESIVKFCLFFDNADKTHIEDIQYKKHKTVSWSESIL